MKDFINTLKSSPLEMMKQDSWEVTEDKEISKKFQQNDLKMKRKIFNKHIAGYQNCLNSDHHENDWRSNQDFRSSDHSHDDWRNIQNCQNLGYSAHNEIPDRLINEEINLNKQNQEVDTHVQGTNQNPDFKKHEGILHGKIYNANAQKCKMKKRKKKWKSDEVNYKVKGHYVFGWKGVESHKSYWSSTPGNKNSNHATKDKKRIVNLGCDPLEEKQVYVENIPLDSSVANIEKLFQKYGTLKNVQLNFSMLSRHLNALICYSDEESAEKALAANKRLFLGQSLVVMMKRDSPYKKNRIVVSNLPAGNVSYDLRNIFMSCGDILELQIYGFGEAYALISYEDPNSVESALLLNYTPLRGRLLYVMASSDLDQYVSNEEKKQRINNTSLDNCPEISPVTASQEEDSHDEEIEDETNSDEDKTETSSDEELEQECNRSKILTRSIEEIRKLQKERMKGGGDSFLKL